ncbi:MAG: alpha/beta hydrolase [Alphaproteobacteria bacterium]|nr:alpha/beta hydrolase [Alphaproteobacteria bacterium]
MRASFVDLDGVGTRYLHAGDGYPILLLHGVGMAADSWVKNIGPLSEQFSVCAPDLLGCGFTDAGPLTDGPPQLAIVAHLSRLIEFLNWRKFAVVGSSLGGLIAVLQYLAMPDRIESLAVVGSAGLLAAEQSELRGIFEASHRNGSQAYADNSMETCRRRLANIVVDIGSIPDSVLLMQINAYALPWSFAAYERRLLGLMKHLDAGPDGWVSHRLEAIRVPTLAIAGKQDPRTNPAWEDRAVRRMPQARRETFDDCGHFPHLEFPDRFNALIAAFVKQYETAPGARG